MHCIYRRYPTAFELEAPISDAIEFADPSVAAHLRRSLGLTELVSIGIGIVLSQGAMVTMLQVAGMGGPGFYIALGVALLLALCYVDSFAELALMMPQAAGLGRYTEVALGTFPAIVANFAGYIVVAFFAIAAELVLVDNVVQQLLPGLLPPNWVAFGVLIFAAALNVCGVDLFARLQTLLTVLKAGSMLGRGALAFSVVAPAASGAAALAAPTAAIAVEWVAVMPLVAAALWGLLGAEYICPMIEEARQPARTVPKAMWITLAVSTLLYVALCAGALHGVRRQELASSGLPHLLLANRVGGQWAVGLVAVAALSASVALVNGALAAVPRMLYGMATEGMAFSMFKRLHPRFQTPWVAIVGLAAAIAASLVLLSGESKGFTVLILSAAASWFLAYIVAHLDVLVLRRRYPHLTRPYRSRWLPWPQLLGIAGMAYAFCNASPDPALTHSIYVNVGVVLALIALIAAVWVRAAMKRKLFEPVAL